MMMPMITGGASPTPTMAIVQVAREGSGTSWQPAASPMRMLAWHLDGWDLMAHGRFQAGLNDQTGLRGGTGDATENWGMLHASHALGDGHLELRSMLSLEPATMPGNGQPQIFQTGETWQGQPLIDRQHTHTLFMELAAEYSQALSRAASFFVYAAPVGEPALGPEAFMHRPSAGENPWAPLGHHLEDSTHISEGVLTEGLVYRGVKLDASLFNGREPGENHWIITPGPLDSYSGRLTWNPDADWSLQVSTGHLAAPEALTPNDQVRTTASVSYDHPFPAGNLAGTLLWGHVHEILANPLDLDAYLAEGALDFGRINHLYSRLESVDKADLAPGLGVQMVEAVTIGGERDVWNNDDYSLGLGADVTANFVPPALQALYGGTVIPAFEVYARIAPPWMEAR